MTTRDRNLRERLTRLEARYTTRTPTLEEALTRTETGQAHQIHFDVIRQAFETQILDQILLWARHYQVQNNRYSRPNGAEPITWAAEIISLTPEDSEADLARNYLELHSREKPAEPLNPHPNNMKRNIRDWRIARVVAPILEDKEQWLRAELHDNPPDITGLEFPRPEW